MEYLRIQLKILGWRIPEHLFEIPYIYSVQKKRGLPELLSRILTELMSCS
jgi:hypothetical protein